jgi:peptidoglycan hydrolase-like protein with peptidoglycan-binding domain
MSPAWLWLTVSREGIDYSYHHALDLDALRAAGVTFAMRYLSHDGTKNLSASEAQLLGASGIDVGVVWESTARRALDGGHAGGASDAATASELATACGMPQGRPIYFAVDFDAGDADKPKIADYLRGAAQVLGEGAVGVYGGYWVVKYCLDESVAAFGWQTYAWSGGQRDPRAHLYQRLNGVSIGGIACDRDTAFATDFGQWRPHSPAPPPFPYPADHYLGTARPDSRCHWGANPIDRHNVVIWQAKLAQRGWRIQANGIYSAQSNRVCRSFQTEKGLECDGMVGPTTWAAAWTSPVT